MKTKSDKINACEIAAVPVDLKTFGDVVNNAVVVKDVYDKLAKKVNVIDTNKLLTKQILMLRSKILKKKCRVKNLATTAALSVTENKMPIVLVI